MRKNTFFLTLYFFNSFFILGNFFLYFEENLSLFFLFFHFVFHILFLGVYLILSLSPDLPSVLASFRFRWVISKKASSTYWQMKLTSFHSWIKPYLSKCSEWALPAFCRAQLYLAAQQRAPGWGAAVSSQNWTWNDTVQSWLQVVTMLSKYFGLINLDYDAHKHLQHQVLDLTWFSAAHFCPSV